MTNNRKLENQLTSRKAESNMRLYVNRWMATERNQWMPKTQSDLVMAGFGRLFPIPLSDLAGAVDTLPAWAEIKERGIEIVRPGVQKVFGAGGQLSFNMIPFMPHPFDPLKRNAALAVDDLASKMIVEITDETRKAVNVILKDGIEKGKGWREIGRELRPKIGLNSRQMMASANREEELLKRGDLSRKQVDDRIAAYDRKQLRRRNETIARTEAQRVLSEGQIQGFEEAMIAVLIWFALVGHDKECAEFQNQEFPIQATHGLQPLHPNCRCGWLPKLAA